MRPPDPFHVAGDHLAIEMLGGRALFSTRRGGVSEGIFASLNLGLGRDVVAAAGLPGAELEFENVLINRARLAGVIGIAPERFAAVRQVHGATVERVTDVPGGAWAAGLGILPAMSAGDDGAARIPAPPPADGQVTGLRGVPVTVLIADCLPVALFARGAVAMLHAGWRGLAAGVLGQGVAALRELGCDGEVVAAIGPGAGRCCYEVGEEVARVFAAHGPQARVGSHLDLKRVAARALRDAGVVRVHDVGLCTICDPQSLFFSHRADGALTGRQAGVAWRD
jgi:YfiH family protein